MDERMIEAAREAAACSGLSAEHLLAIALVETGGIAGARVAGREEPLIRFEGHHFDRRLQGGARTRARSEGLAHPKAGAVRNPASQAARWNLLDRASEIDAEAAAASTSWGVGQVMGSHGPALGYGSALGLARTARASLAGQFAVLAAFLRHTGLAARLAAGDLEGFARGYNGPQHARNDYVRKIGEALERVGLSPKALDAPTRLLQTGLAGLGVPLAVDGQAGPLTELAVAAFRVGTGLAAKGGTHDAMWERLAGRWSAESLLAERETVETVQRALLALGERLTADGVAGPVTRAAIARFVAALESAGRSAAP